MLTELKKHEHPIYGPMPADMWFGTNAIDGDAAPFTLAPVGQVYIRKDTTNNLMQVWVKRKHVPHDNDWGPIGGLGVISQTVDYDDFTDETSVGTYVLGQTIPVNAVVVKTIVSVESGFIGDTTATLQVGDGTDADRYTTGTPSVFTTDTAVDVGAVSGTAWHNAAISTVELTITPGTAWAAVTAGRLTVTIFYYL
jgi:hypothetical protein